MINVGKLTVNMLGYNFDHVCPHFLLVPAVPTYVVGITLYKHVALAVNTHQELTGVSATSNKRRRKTYSHTKKRTDRYLAGRHKAVPCSFHKKMYTKKKKKIFLVLCDEKLQQQAHQH